MALGVAANNGYMAPRPPAQTGYMNNMSGGKTQTPTSSYFAANGYGTRDYSSIPEVPWAQTDFGKNFGQGMELFGGMGALQEQALKGTGSYLAGQINSLPGQYQAKSGALRSTYNNQIAGNQIDYEGNQSNRNIYEALARINSQGYQNTMGEISNQAMQQRRAATHDAVARGAYGGVGTGQDFTDIASNQQDKLGGAEAQYLTQQNSVMRNLNDIDTQARKYRLAPQQFLSQLQTGLTQLGIDQTMSISTLMNAMNSNNLQQAQFAQGVIEKALTFAQTRTS